MNILFYDTETTGEEYWRHGIHQLAGIFEMDGVEKFRFSYNLAPVPGTHINPKSLGISRVTLEEIKKYPLPNIALDDLLAKLDQHVDHTQRAERIVLCGHNIIQFDNPFLERLFKICGNDTFYSRFWKVSFDTMQMALYRFGANLSEVNSFGLKALCGKMGIGFNDEHAHKSIYDAEKAKQLFKAYMHYRMEWEEATFSNNKNYQLTNNHHDKITEEHSLHNEGD